MQNWFCCFHPGSPKTWLSISSNKWFKAIRDCGELSSNLCPEGQRWFLSDPHGLILLSEHTKPSSSTLNAENSLKTDVSSTLFRTQDPKVRPWTQTLTVGLVPGLEQGTDSSQNTQKQDFRTPRGHPGSPGSPWFSTQFPPGTYRTLQDLRDPFFLLQDVEVLAEVGRHVPGSEVLWVVDIHAVKVALLGAWRTRHHPLVVYCTHCC